MDKCHLALAPLNQLVVGSIPTRPTNSARIAQSFRGTFASLESDVVPLSAESAVGESKSAWWFDSRMPQAPSERHG
jgi:hypothetical protein